MNRVALTFLLLLPLVTQADRYYTWIDEKGAVRHTLIPEENPILKRAEQLRKQRAYETTVTDMGGGTATASPELRQSATEMSDEQLSSVSEVPQSNRRGNAAPDTAAPVAVEASGAAESGSDQTRLAVQPSDTKNSFADSTYSLDDYVDAGELARRGYVREGQGSRFYTWVDQNGIIYNSPYPPAGEEPTDDVHEEPDVHTSPFLVEERAEVVSPVSLTEVDDFARRLFQLDEKPQGRIHQFRELCCNALPIAKIGEVDVNDGYTVEFDDETERFSFTTGSSVYELIRLPMSQKGYRLRLRSFINNQLFFPSLVFLDAHLTPQRFVSNVIYDYEPENWFRYGYLEGLVDVETHRGERYLLILSTKEDQNGQTTVERKNKPVQYPHGQVGLIHLSVVKPGQT